MDKFSIVLLQVSKQHETGQVKPDCPLPHDVPPVQPTTWGLHKQRPPGLDTSTPAPGEILGTVALRLSQVPHGFSFILKRKQKALVQLKSSKCTVYPKFP